MFLTLYLIHDSNFLVTKVVMQRQEMIVYNLMSTQQQHVQTPSQLN